MALPNGLPQVSDLGQLLSTLGSNIVNLPKMQATSAPGTPAAGYFHSTVINRAEMPDLRKDLSVNLGINRISLQQLVQINDEAGSNSAPVYKAANDPLDRVRVVGTSDAQNNTAGQFFRVGILGDLNTGYIEITYYGTGLNILITQPGATHTAVYSVNGGAETSVNIPAMAAIIANRNYSANCVVPVISNQALGLYTVKIRNTGLAATHIHGFEILNTSADIKINEGSIWSSGKGLYNPSQQSISYSSSFESGVSNGRGGRVVVYQKPNGDVAKAITPVDNSSATLSSASHTNEEIARVYHIREFGAGRADDFSLFASGTPSQLAFTLDDGTTSLTATGAYWQSSNMNGGLSVCGTNGAFGVFTFVGTGLDLVCNENAAGGADTYNFQIDGGATIPWPNTAGNTTPRVQKIVSGLPYGTHTFRLNRVTAASWNISIQQFIVYQPKKPTIPTGAVELADYNLMANYVQSTANGATHTFSTGVLTKYNTRELVYVGSGWGIGAVDTATNWISGFRTQTTGVSTTDYMEYTFYGTGIELDLFVGGSGSATMNVQVDGVNWSGTTNVRGAGYSWSSPTLTATAVSVGCKLQLTGMTLSKHTVRITRTSASTDMSFGGVHVITPVHSYKEKESFTLQNTSPIGSQGINDSRKFISRDGLVRHKSVSQAIGIAASPTSNITSFIPVPDLSVTHSNTTGKIKVSYSLDVFGTASSVGLFRIFVDGISVSDSRTYTGPTGGSGDTRLISDSIVIPVSPGIHKVDVMWLANTGTITAGFSRRTLLVEEVD